MLTQFDSNHSHVFSRMSLMMGSVRKRTMMEIMAFHLMPTWENRTPMSLLDLEMLINIAFDFFIRFIPLPSDIMDAMYKANSKNVRLLEKHLDDIHHPHANKDTKKRHRESMLGAYTPPGIVLVHKPWAWCSPRFVTGTNHTAVRCFNHLSITIIPTAESRKCHHVHHRGR